MLVQIVQARNSVRKKQEFRQSPSYSLTHALRVFRLVIHVSKGSWIVTNEAVFQ